MKTHRSDNMWRKAMTIFPGGVNSPVRAFSAVGGSPIFIQRGSGAYLWDVDGNKFVDFVQSWGASILGHADPDVVMALNEAVSQGTGFGAPTERENILGQKIISAMPAIEKIRFVSTGTEACMTAIRLARAVSGRELIVKFSGHYHGHSDSLLAKAGSGVVTLGLPNSPGITEAQAASTIVVPFNDDEALSGVFERYGDRVAGVIFEPIVGNSGFIRPKDGFLRRVSELCDKFGSLTICDEVMTGFRVDYEGAQGFLDIRPDITTLGKVIGGGLPLAAVGGKAEIMDQLAPAGSVYQAGTLSGNPLATAAGAVVIEKLAHVGIYSYLDRMCERLVKGICTEAAKLEVPLCGDWAGGMFGFFFSSDVVSSFEQAQSTATGLFEPFFRGMLERGIYLAPSPYEAGFISLAHTESEIDRAIAAAGEALAELRQPGA